VPVTTRRGCCAGGARDGDDLEKAGSGGFNGVDSRKASGGFLKQQQKKKKKRKRKAGEKAPNLPSTWSVGLAWLMCIITDHYDYFHPCSVLTFCPPSLPK
jgi:hypothetical protein